MVRLRSPAPYGGFPERPKGADCKSVVTDFGGPNPPSPTKQKTTTKVVVFCLARWSDEATDARTKKKHLASLCWWFLPPSKARVWSRIHHPPPTKTTTKVVVFCLARWSDEATDARTQIKLSFPLCRWFLPPSKARVWSRIHHPPPTKTTTKVVVFCYT